MSQFRELDFAPEFLEFVLVQIEIAAFFSDLVLGLSHENLNEISVLVLNFFDELYGFQVGFLVFQDFALVVLPDSIV